MPEKEGRRRVVITGMGVISPVGNTLEDFWRNLLAGKSGAAPITYFDASSLPVRFACEVKDFHPEDWLEKKEIRRTDRFVWYAVASATQALQDAGLYPPPEDLQERFGIIWASGIGGIITYMNEVAKWGRDPSYRFTPLFIPKVIADSAAGYLSIRFGLRGPNYATVSACASSAHAIIDATLLIRGGYADIVLAGGSEAPICPIGIAGFAAMKALSERNESPETASRPYDRDRDGFVMGEGAGALVLEDYEHARKRGARIYGEIVGIGMNADAYHITAPHPEGIPASGVMKLALEDGGLQPSDVDYINAHGTSTPLGDIAELKAIVRAFGESSPHVAISSTKSMMGHLLGAAGVVETIVCVLAVYHDVVPPTINHFTDDPEIPEGVHLVFWKPVQKTVRYALNNSFGFGGHNACIVVGKVRE